MVVLVRCCDETFALALESRLNELTASGLISAVLRDGTWIDLQRVPQQPKSASLRRAWRRLATVAPL